jgi:hypothetical protein
LGDGLHIKRVGSSTFEIGLEMLADRFEMIELVFNKENDRFCHAPLIQQIDCL